MASTASISEWCRFLGAQDTHEARAELHRLITRLDDAYDTVNYVLKLLNGAPGDEVDSILFITRSTLIEAMNSLTAARRRMENGDPEAA
ncbi:hypothetical protein [Nocardioides daphniae]|uniref:Uncharacterized protein n=1 Tax=Nocardioides daphniae TaxID=402297 RepID=A0A4P7UER1_9ACTN|nr:hypothetical protein [Nocardioides daphniae]QCC78414.1 hypothetical protein E2C04_16640 [Nocardioides daphniae]GGD12634.1 hypothetical protein GCM10007231_09560 [Nocardioides daphniae]